MISPKSCLLILIFLLVDVAAAQISDSTQRNDGIVRKMYAGAVQSLAWYDVPIATADVAEMIFVPANAAGKPIKFPPTRFDTKFQSHVGMKGSQTFVGRAGDAGAAAFLGLRLLVNIGSDLAGGDVTSEDYHRTFWFYKSLVYCYSLTLLTKNLVYRERPDGSDGQSFFSGHSSTAFCIASYLSLEVNDWYDRWETTRSDEPLRLTCKIGTDAALLAGATYVAYSRMHDEKHYFTDVAVGAAVGTAVGALMYPWNWNSGLTASQDVSFFVVDGKPVISCVIQF